MTALEFWYARRLIAEESVGKHVRHEQRATMEADAQQTQEMEDTKAMLKAMGLVG